MRQAVVILLLAVCFGVFAHVPTGAAQVGYDVNKRYVCFEGSRELTAPGPNAPRLVNATLDRFPMLAFRLCSDKWGQHYFLRTAQPIADGVCAFDEREVFPGVEPDDSGAEALAANAPGFVPTLAQPPQPWRTVGPLAEYRASFMTAQQAGCPSLQSRNYASVANLTPAEFVSLRSTWLALGQSEEIFASALAGLPQDCGIMPGFPPELQQRTYDRLRASLHAFLFDPGASLYVTRITRRANSYDVAVTERADPGHLADFVLTIEDSGGTLRLTCLGALYVA